MMCAIALLLASLNLAGHARRVQKSIGDSPTAADRRNRLNAKAVPGDHGLEKALAFNPSSLRTSITASGSSIARDLNAVKRPAPVLGGLDTESPLPFDRPNAYGRGRWSGEHGGGLRLSVSGWGRSGRGSSGRGNIDSSEVWRPDDLPLKEKLDPARQPAALDAATAGDLATFEVKVPKAKLTNPIAPQQNYAESPASGIEEGSIDLDSLTVLDLKVKLKDLSRLVSGQQAEIISLLQFARDRLEEDIERLVRLRGINLNPLVVSNLKIKLKDLSRRVSGQQAEIISLMLFTIDRLEEDIACLVDVPMTDENTLGAKDVSAEQEDSMMEQHMTGKRFDNKDIKYFAAAREEDVVQEHMTEKDVNDQEHSSDHTDFATQQLVTADAFQMEVALKNIRWDVLPPKRSFKAKTHRTHRQYLFSNEGEHYFWREAMDNLGGIMVSVGAEQNYLMAGWARPELLILMDLNPTISMLHKSYRVAFELAETPDEFIELWGDADGIEKMSAGAISIYGDTQDGEDVLQMITGHPAISQGLIGLSLRKMKEKYDNLEVPCYLNTQEQYSHIRDLYKSGRVLAILGDLTGTKTMADISALSRDSGLPIRVLYISNAMYQITVSLFDVPPELLARFRDNILGLPFDEKSLVLHTVQSNANMPGGRKVAGKTMVRQSYMSQALGQSMPLPSEKEPGKSWIFHKTRGVEFHEWLEEGKRRKEEAGKEEEASSR